LTDTETKLAQAKKDRDLALAEANNEVDRLAKLVAEEKKPKPLRHLDVIYGIPSYEYKGGTYVAVEQSPLTNMLDVFGVRDGIGFKNGKIDKCNQTAYTYSGINLADDLNAIAEPLESFYVNDVFGRAITFEIISDGKVRIQMACGYEDIHIEAFSEAVLKLRGMQAFINKENS